MSILIKGMEMPTSCMLCPFCVEEADPANGEMCMVTGKLMPPCTRVRLEDCPLIPVPDHGWLIEERHAIRAFYDTYKEYGLPWRNAEVVFEVCPTILPADKEAGE